ncbi:MAG: transporter substrate-binding protein [Paucimonas sp.]|nr:transporter substrate-binding protein [Paucimonas sp.]
MRIKNLFAVLVSIATGAASFTAHADVVIAQSAPLSGEAADVGNGLALGSRIYFEHVNATEGGVNGHKIIQVVKDDGYKIDATVKNTRDFIADPKVVALTGYYGTDNVSELFKQSLFDNTPLALVGASTGARLLREPLNPNIFHLRASYADEIEAIVRHVDGLGTKRIAVFYEENPFGDAGVRALEDAARKRNIAVAARAPYEPYTTKVDRAVKDVLAVDPDAVVMIALTAPAAEFVKLYRTGGGRGFLFNISTANVEGMTKAIGAKVAQGVGISQVFPFPYSATLPLVAEYQGLMARYAKGTPYSYATMEGFVNAKVLVAALRKAGREPTRASVKQALQGLGQMSLGGYPISFAPNNHVGSRFVELTVVSKSGNLMR